MSDLIPNRFRTPNRFQNQSKINQTFLPESASPLGAPGCEASSQSSVISNLVLVSGLWLFRIWSQDFKILGVYWQSETVYSRPQERVNTIT